MNQHTKALEFHRLHRESHPLVLPNAWDVASARAFAAAGFPAIATSSLAVAATLGYEDGEQISRDEMLDVVRRIARAVDVPVTADLEAGYGATPEAVGTTVGAAIEAGAVGMNLEDSRGDVPPALFDAGQQVARIQAAREAAARHGVPFFINARIDVYLMQIGEPESRLAETAARARLYRAAGADCLFVPGVRDAAPIGALVGAIEAPVSVLAGAGTPPVAELGRLGVTRVSVGSGAFRATLNIVRDVARELLDHGTYTRLG